MSLALAMSVARRSLKHPFVVSPFVSFLPFACFLTIHSFFHLINDPFAKKSVVHRDVG
jgi:hypothetical protein